MGSGRGSGRGSGFGSGHGGRGLMQAADPLPQSIYFVSLSSPQPTNNSAKMRLTRLFFIAVILTSDVSDFIVTAVFIDQEKSVPPAICPGEFLPPGMLLGVAAASRNGHEYQ